MAARPFKHPRVLSKKVSAPVPSPADFILDEAECDDFAQVDDDFMEDPGTPGFVVSDEAEDDGEEPRLFFHEVCTDLAPGTKLIVGSDGRLLPLRAYSSVPTALDKPARWAGTPLSVPVSKPKLKLSRKS
jgi:hypothetical protein